LIPQTKDQLAKYFDHTILDCMATEADIQRHCDEALEYFKKQHEYKSDKLFE